MCKLPKTRLENSSCLSPWECLLKVRSGKESIRELDLCTSQSEKTFPRLWCMKGLARWGREGVSAKDNFTTTLKSEEWGSLGRTVYCWVDLSISLWPSTPSEAWLIWFDFINMLYLHDCPLSNSHQMVKVVEITELMEIWLQSITSHINETQC